MASNRSRNPTNRSVGIDDFFSRYPVFEYNARNPVWDEFNRMCDFFNWREDDYALRNARRDFKSAMVEHFNCLYGSDENDLKSWHALGRILKIRNMPQEVEACRQLVRQSHVNLVDLVDTTRTGQPVRVFHSLEQLQVYTIRTEKFFPRKDAYAGGLLRYLLREIL